MFQTTLGLTPILKTNDTNWSDFLIAFFSEILIMIMQAQMG